MDWFERAKELKAQGYSYREIGEMLGKARQTVKNRFHQASKKLEGKEEHKPRVADYGESYEIISGQRTITVTKEKLRKLKQLYCEQKLTINAVCRELNIPRPDFNLIKTAFGITKDDVPYIDEDLFDNDIDSLVEETLERRKQQYFLKLQQKEIQALKNEVNKYRTKDYWIDKIHRLVTEYESQFERPHVPYRPPVKSGLMLEVPIVDLHVAKLAWAPETGEDYDSKIAYKRFMAVIHDVVERSKRYKFEQIVFPIGNDFLNYDTVKGETTRGTQQDCDSRWAKMYVTGKQMLIEAIELLSQIAPITVFHIPGNHDFATSFYLIDTLYSWFRNDENVTVDASPKSRKYVEFGKCLIGFTHGDKEKKRIFGNMQVEVPEAWGRTLYREWHLGHMHSEQVKEEHGIKVRNLSSVVGTDAWHFESGFVGAIAVSQSFVWDKERGLREIWYSAVS